MYVNCIRCGMICRIKHWADPNKALCSACAWAAAQMQLSAQTADTLGRAMNARGHAIDDDVLHRRLGAAHAAKWNE